MDHLAIPAARLRAYGWTGIQDDHFPALEGQSPSHGQAHHPSTDNNDIRIHLWGRAQESKTTSETPAKAGSHGSVVGQVGHRPTQLLAAQALQQSHGSIAKRNRVRITRCICGSLDST